MRKLLRLIVITILKEEMKALCNAGLALQAVLKFEFISLDYGLEDKLTWIDLLKFMNVKRRLCPEGISRIQKTVLYFGKVDLFAN